MYDHEIRWSTLIPVSLVMGLLVLFAETSGLLPAIPVRPDWFWCLAFFAALRAPPVQSIFVFAWCGLARDLLLGPKMGSSALAFVLGGWIALYLKPVASLRGWIAQAATVAASAFLVAAAKHGLDAGRLAGGLWDRIFFLSAGDALATGVFYLPLVLVFCIPSFRPWRERFGYY